MVELVACFRDLLSLLVEVLNHIRQPHPLLWLRCLLFSDDEVDKASFTDSSLREALIITE